MLRVGWASRPPCCASRAGHRTSVRMKCLSTLVVFRKMRNTAGETPTLPETRALARSNGNRALAGEFAVEPRVAVHHFFNRECRERFAPRIFAAGVEACAVAQCGAQLGAEFFHRAE